MMVKQKGTVLHLPVRIGIIGGGQLGRMLAVAAKQRGHHVTVLDPPPWPMTLRRSRGGVG